MGVWLGPMNNGSGPIQKKSDISYSESSGYEFYIDNTGNWEIRLTKSGNLKFKKNPGDIDVFLVGYGQAGNIGSNNNNNGVNAGTGGYGGQCINHTFTNIIKNTLYPVVIGKKLENTDEDTNIFGYTAYGGGKTINGSTVGQRGGTGAEAHYYNNSNYGKSNASSPNTTYGAAKGLQAFGDSSSYFGGGHYFGSGGGGGGAAYNVEYNGTVHSDSANPAIGADTYAGTGGTANGEYITVTSGGEATPNTGCGGGGGAAVRNGYNSDNSKFANGGAGSNGVIIIRNNRGTTFS